MEQEGSNITLVLQESFRGKEKYLCTQTGIIIQMPDRVKLYVCPDQFHFGP